jgi:ankyrin repeat protein
MRALETLPRTVDALYQQSLSRIDLLPEVTRHVVYRSLSWLMFSWRPLKMIELRWAIALTESKNATVDSLCSEDVIISSCTGLIRVNHAKEVTFVRQYFYSHHTRSCIMSYLTPSSDFTVQKYLVKAAATDSDSPKFLKQSDIFQLCLAFLSFKENLQYTVVGRDLKTGKRIAYKHPFLQYCALGWARHGKIACDHDPNPAFIRRVISLFGDHQKAILIVNVLRDEGIYHGYSDGILSPLHIYACLGLRQLVMHLLPRHNLKVTRRLDRFMPTLPGWLWKRSLINKKDYLQDTALSLAIQAGHTDLALYLVDHPKIDINISHLARRCSLSYAAEKGDVAVARALLKRGAKHDKCDGRLRTPLSYAASKDAIEMVELLLCTPGSGNPDIPDQTLRTPLSHAASANAIGAARLILNSGNVNVNSKDDLGRTPLFYAASIGAIDFVKLLLDIGKARLDTPDCFGRTPLSSAVRKGRTAMVKFLVETGADADARDEEGRTPLSHAAGMRTGEGGTDIIKLLLESGKGVDCDSRSTLGRTPLWFAALSGSISRVKLLLATGTVRIDSQDVYGQTPLAVAAKQLDYRMVRLLLEENADVNMKDNQGRTPLFLAKSHRSFYPQEDWRRQERCVSLLSEKGGQSEPSQRAFGRLLRNEGR